MTTPTASSDDQAAPRRMTMGRVVELLLTRGGSEHSSVTITRNAKGDAQLEVVVRTGEGDSPQTVEQAEAIAVSVYDRLRERYPYGAAPQASAGANGGA